MVCVKVHLFFSFIQHAENLYSAKNQQRPKNLATQNSYCPDINTKKIPKTLDWNWEKKNLIFWKKEKKPSITSR